MCVLYCCLFWGLHHCLLLAVAVFFCYDTFCQWWGTFLKIIQQYGLLHKLTRLLLDPKLLVTVHEMKGLGVVWASASITNKAV